MVTIAPLQNPALPDLVLRSRESASASPPRPKLGDGWDDGPALPFSVDDPAAGRPSQQDAGAPADPEHPRPALDKAGAQRAEVVRERVQHARVSVPAAPATRPASTYRFAYYRGYYYGAGGASGASSVAVAVRVKLRPKPPAMLHAGAAVARSPALSKSGPDPAWNGSDAIAWRSGPADRGHDIRQTSLLSRVRADQAHSLSPTETHSQREAAIGARRTA